MGLEESFDLAAQIRVAAAFPLQHRRPLGRGQLGQRMKDALDALKIDWTCSSHYEGAPPSKEIECHFL
jgi:hypothetical protein